jgi:hypothetical protein
MEHVPEDFVSKEKFEMAIRLKKLRHSSLPECGVIEN